MAATLCALEEVVRVAPRKYIGLISSLTSILKQVLPCPAGSVPAAVYLFGWELSGLSIITTAVLPAIYTSTLLLSWRDL